MPSLPNRTKWKACLATKPHGTGRGSRSSASGFADIDADGDEGFGPNPGPVNGFLRQTQPADIYRNTDEDLVVALAIAGKAATLARLHFPVQSTSALPRRLHSADRASGSSCRAATARANWSAIQRPSRWPDAVSSWYGSTCVDKTVRLPILAARLLAGGLQDGAQRAVSVYEGHGDFLKKKAQPVMRAAPQIFRS